MHPAASTSALNRKKIKSYLASIAIGICRRLPAVVYRNAAEFGQSLEYSHWVTREFGSDAFFVATRQQLWRRMISCLPPDCEVTAFEFGVAYGHATRWWMSQSSPISKWYGFDTFAGLANRWRHFEAGAFDANGEPPQMSDSRVEWVVGKVEDTFTVDRIQVSPPQASPGTQRLFLFDLDNYEPTKCVAEKIFPHLEEGDILYFDEAADWDERRVLVEEMDRSPNEIEQIGATPMALALRVTGRIR